VAAVSVYGKFTPEISDDPRYEKGKTYDLVLSTGVTPDPATVVVASVDPSTSPSEPATQSLGG